MSTDTESTLEINEFRGVNRYVEGTVRPPNQFQVIQNMNVPNDGELATNGGMTEASENFADDLYLNNINYLSQSLGETPSLVTPAISKLSPRKQVVGYLASNDFPTIFPSGMVFTAQGTGSTAHKVRTVFVALGGVEQYTETSSVNFGSLGCQVTLPTNTPDYVYCVNFYVEEISGGVTGTFIWAGSLTRVEGVFPASVILPEPVATGNSNNTVYAATPTSAAFTIGVDTINGRLSGGRIYYFGVAPWIGRGGSVVRWYDASTRLFSVFLPEGYNTITVSFSGLPAQAGDVTPANYSSVVLFMGTTPEDMLPVTVGTAGGKPVPISKTDAASGVTIYHLPVNSNMAPTAAQISWGSGSYSYNMSAIAGRVQGSMVLSRPTSLFTQSLSLGLTSFRGFFVVDDHDAIPSWSANRVELLKNYDIFGYTVKSQSGFAGAVPSAISWFPGPGVTPGSLISQPSPGAAQFGNLMVYADSTNTLYYTNGVVLKQIIPDNGKAKIPITSNVISFQNRLVAGGGTSNWDYTSSTVTYSEAANMNDFGSTLNSFSVIGQEGSEIQGFVVYSQNLLNTGLGTFLVIGKQTSCFTWNGLTGADMIVAQLENSTGFAGPRSFCQTKFGPVYVGYDNLYLVRSQTEVVPIGYEFRDVLVGFNARQRERMLCSWHQDNVKISYTSETGLPSADLLLCDREIWMQMTYVGGEVRRAWSGPHIIPRIKDVAVCDLWDPTAIGTNNPKRDLRYAIHNDELAVSPFTVTSQVVLMDDPASSEQLGDPQSRQIVISNLGLQADHFRKLLNRVYLAVQQAENLSITATLDFEDGSTPATLTLTKNASGTVRNFLQAFVTTRKVGRITKLTLDWDGTLPMSIYDISLLFKVQRRRLIT